MPFHERLSAAARHELWGELCLLSEHLYELADEIHELTLKWWDADPELEATHYQRCLSSDQLAPPTPTEDTDDIDF